MANNQITPFQLTDQFTMDNFNQRINETNTALQNNDPRQWGLGADSILIDSLDNALETGWYKSNGGTPASGYWNCLTERYNSQSVTQTAVEYDGYGATIARRMLSLGVFGPWEWVNPPMQLGIEYRTTERYLGKPVYAKLVDFGALPNSTTKDVDAGISSSEIYENRMIDLGKSTAYNPSDGRTSVFPIGAGIVNIYINNGAIRITTNTDRSGWSAKICVKYTKTTD